MCACVGTRVCMCVCAHMLGDGQPQRQAVLCLGDLRRKGLLRLENKAEGAQDRMPVEPFQCSREALPSRRLQHPPPSSFNSCFTVPSSGHAAALEKPTLSVHPPWTTIFKGERVTLRCDGYHPLVVALRPISTLWYLGHLLLPSHRRSIEVQTPGVYRCQTRGALVSDPVHLSVSNDWLILQVPYAAVFEGDPLVLRCRGWYDKVVYKLHYYRDGQALRYFPSSANYTVAQARASDSGLYQCSGTMRIPVESAPMFSAKVAVTVQGGGGPGPGRAAKSLGILGREPGGERGRRVTWRIPLPDHPQTSLLLTLWGTRLGGSSNGGDRCGTGARQAQRPPRWRTQAGCQAGCGPVPPLLSLPSLVAPLPRFRSLSSSAVLVSWCQGARPAPWTAGRAPGPLAPASRASSAPPLSAELFPAPVLKVAGRAEAGGVVVRCDTRVHPRKRAAPLQFSFYKYSRAVRRFDWGAEYTVPAPEVDELESHWCEAATASRSVRKRSAWLQLREPGSPTAAPGPQAAALAPGNRQLSFQKSLVSTSGLSVTSVPNATSVGLRVPTGRVASAAPAACAPRTPLEQSPGSLKPDVDQLLREMRLLKGLLSRVLLELRDPQAFPEREATLHTPLARSAEVPGAAETSAAGS
nr:PREDICTED: Fc receptor-like B isoform X2 [Rhinolophus sinicus]